MERLLDRSPSLSHLLAMTVLLLSTVPSISASAPSKYACDYSNRLCEWKARYMFGATVLDDKAFFHGGILSNEATIPVNSSGFEVLDLKTMAPMIVQIDDKNNSVLSSRYRHQLAAWKNTILAVGGQIDDDFGVSRHIINVLVLNLNQRLWEVKKQFIQRSGASGQGDVMIDASVVSGDQLLVTFLQLDPTNFGRSFFSMNLNNQEVDYNFNVAYGAGEKVLDWPLLSLMTLGKDGDFPHILLQSKRLLSKPDNDTAWFEITGKGEIGVDGPLPFTASTAHWTLPGGGRSKVLSLKLLRVLDKPTLLIWAVTKADFADSRGQTVNAVSLWDVSMNGVMGKRNVSLRLSRIAMTLPSNMTSAAGLQSIDLPLVGKLSVGAKDVMVMPYIGNVDLVSELDYTNVDMQQWPGKGFIIRGSSMTDPHCQPIVTWQPFVVAVNLAASAKPAIRALSNSTFCSSRLAQLRAAAIVGDAAAMETGAKLHRVDSSQGPLLMILSSERKTRPGGQLLQLDIHAPLRGALVDLDGHSVQNLSVPLLGDYQHPVGIASCTTYLNGTAVYLQTGGWYHNDDDSTQQAQPGVIAVPINLSQPVQPMLKVTGSSEPKGTAYSSLACSAQGEIYMYGGLVIDRYKATPINHDEEGKPDSSHAEPVWASSGNLQAMRLSGSTVAPTLSKSWKLVPSASQNRTDSSTSIPSPRSGHTLTYLPQETVASMGLSSGALLLFGGSNSSNPSLISTLADMTAAAEALADVDFDRSAWLFDLKAHKWSKLQAQGLNTPPGLMHHSAAVVGTQVMVWGGLRLVSDTHLGKAMQASTDLYILDFSRATPRWRVAAVDNTARGGSIIGFPNSGIAALPEIGVIAVMHRSGISVAAIPQSIHASFDAIVSNWTLNTLNLTAGDWIRLQASTSGHLVVKEPLLLGSNTDGVTITGLGVAQTASSSRDQPTHKRTVLRCDKYTTTAVHFRSSGAVLEDLSLTGCNGTAVQASVDSTGSYANPASLSNVGIINNSGTEGAAVHIGPGAAVVLDNCTLSGNKAADSSVLGQAGSQMAVRDTNITSNKGSGIVFAGANITITGCRFSNNGLVFVSTDNTTSQKAATAATGPKLGGALRLLCEGLTLTGCSSNPSAYIFNSTFMHNSAQLAGGAVYLGPGTFAAMQHSNLSNNTAADGGAVLADRDACLFNMTTVRFDNNSASNSGGGVSMRGATCRDDMVARGLTFCSNTAGASGGAMCLTEMINRNISVQANFTGNKVLGVSASATTAMKSPVARSTGNGGALYLGLWSSNVTLLHTTFANNTASGSGGAVEILAIGSTVLAVNTTAAHNVAGPMQLMSVESYQTAVQSDGGAIHVQGNDGHLVLLGVHMQANRAGRGGAVSVNSDFGGFVSINSSFSNNTALTAGGAVMVTEHKAATLRNTSFQGNRLLWPGIAAGGGFSCYQCDSVVIKYCRFVANVATYGGGAAILQSARSAVVTGTLFVHNVALQAMGQGEAVGHSRVPVSASPSAGQQSARKSLLPGDITADALGPVASNTTADAGLHKGGGGLYISVNSRVELNDSCFANNVALNGGGLLALTDACQDLGSRKQPCQLVMSSVSILDSNKATAAGSGLMVTKVQPPWVHLADCLVGATLNLTTSLKCLQIVNTLCHSGHGRVLLQAMPGAASVGTAAGSAPDFLVTSAAGMRCSRFQSLSSSIQLTPEDCSQTVQAGPGIPLNMALQLFDDLGRHIPNALYDASMPMEASVRNANGTPAVLLIGNITNAVNGTGFFSSLRIFGRPGADYQLLIRARNGLSLIRNLVLRECQAGEHNLTHQALPDQSNSCESCNSPEYSFYPQASHCGQCFMLGSNSYSVCDSAVVVPADGWYQSHPHNPLLHRCITAAACSRGSDVHKQMADWAAAAAAMSITQLNQDWAGQPHYQPYLDQMCSKGYTGPLCGSCTEGHGHSGQRCIECIKRSANSFCYFLVCLFMFLVPALQTLLHSKNMGKRHKQHQIPGTMGLGSTALATLPMTPQQSLDHNMQHTAVLAQPHDKDAASAASPQPSNAGIILISTAQQPDHQEYLAVKHNPYKGGTVSGQTAAGDAGAQGVSPSHQASPATEDDVGPFYDVSPFHGDNAAHSPSSQSSQQLPAAPTAALTVPGSQPAPVPRTKSVSILANWFSTKRADQNSVSQFCQHPSSHAALTLPATSAASPAVCKPQAAACPARPNFYHTDVLTMIVGYMQLLGLLRLIRLDWSRWLKAALATLTYLDFTSGVSTWVSIECSFDSDRLPKSVKRSLVLLMWPVCALLFLGILWLSFACLTSRRQPFRHGLQAQVKRLGPYMVLSALTMTYFLYTPTSREIITLFSCQPVDTIEALQRIAPQYTSTPDALDALLDLTPVTWGWQGVWTSDTCVLCGSPAHLGMAVGLGIPGLIVWVFGLPIALWFVLRRHSKHDAKGQCGLVDPMVELKYGIMYDKYRYKRYYWECVVLLQNCALTMLLVLLQSQPAVLQILVALAVIIIGLILQITYKPYVVAMLDTLRKLSAYALMVTVFCMALVNVPEFEERQALPLVVLVVIATSNIAVLAVHLWAMLHELRRWILYEMNASGRKRFTWGDLQHALHNVMHTMCGGRLQGVVRRSAGPVASLGTPSGQQAC